MNDYLDTLLACTLRPQETIQPRRRGRYEPLNYSRGLAMAPPLDLTGLETADPAKVEVSQAGPSSPERAPPAQSPPAETLSLSPIVVSTTPGRPVQTEPAPVEPLNPSRTTQPVGPAQAAAISTVDVGLVQAGPTPITVRPTPPTRPAPPSVQWARESTTAAMNPSEPEPVNLAVGRRRTVVGQQAAREQSVPSEQAVVNPVVNPVASPAAHAEHQPAAIAGNEPLTPAIQPRPVSPAPPRIKPALPHAFGEPSNPRPAEAPTIQVTIGRIEVRATPPVAPVPKPRPASPKLSLDDYLCQRNEGKR